jgi:hypothetical protein
MNNTTGIIKELLVRISKLERQVAALNPPKIDESLKRFDIKWYNCDVALGIQDSPYTHLDYTFDDSLSIQISPESRIFVGFIDSRIILYFDNNDENNKSYKVIDTALWSARDGPHITNIDNEGVATLDRHWANRYRNIRTPEFKCGLNCEINRFITIKSMSVMGYIVIFGRSDIKLHDDKNHYIYVNNELKH